MMEKKVFISHSSKDKCMADEICMMLETNGIGCWIAPRDIPYGNEWAGEITKALRNARVCIFLFSENSNQSKQVAKEIQIAIDNEVIIIPIRVDDAKMNDVLTYYLATMHWVLNFDEGILLERVNQALKNHGASSNLCKQNIDETLRAKIAEHFGDKVDDNEDANDSQTNRLKTRIAKKYIDRLINNLVEIAPEKEDNSSKEETTFDSEDEGKHFSIVDNEDQVTLAFAVYPLLDIERRVFKKSYLEELPYVTTPIENGRTKKTFYINYHRYYGIPITTRMALITFCKNKHCLLINNGVCEGDKVYLSKKPQVEFWDAADAATMPQCNYKVESDGLIVQFDADAKSDIVIIDLENICVMKRKRQYDAISNQVIASINLEVDKPYFVVKTESDEENVDDITIALGYLHGLWGLQHNVLKAVEMLEDNDSARAHFILAKIFKNDELLSDRDDYINNLIEAAGSGHVESMLLLSNEYIDGKECVQNYEAAKELLEAIVEKCPQHGVAWNNLGWLYKNGFGCIKDLKKSLPLFEKSAQCGCKTAYKHLSQIALLSEGSLIEYVDGLFYLCCAERMGVNGTSEIFEQYHVFIDDFQLVLDQCRQKAAEQNISEQKISRETVEDTSSDFLRLVGGFPRWN